jgi:RNA-directed DNA polymerase
MIKTPIDLQDLRRKIYTKAKADTAWRFWGLYVHVGKMETLHEAYLLAKKNNGAPGLDGVTFAAIEAGGVESFLLRIRDELAAHHLMRARGHRGFGWDRWSSRWLYEDLGLYDGYQVRRPAKTRPSG